MNVLIADEHALFRDALGKLVEQLDASSTIMQASNFAQALKILDTGNKFDLVIIDLDMRDMPREKGLAEVCGRCGNAKLVVMSADENVRDIRVSLTKGAKGFISKCADAKLLSGALKLVLDGGVYVPPIMLMSEQEISSNKNKLLTNRQSEVLNLVAQGLSNKQIAFQIGVSEATVKLHINALLRAVGANNRTQAVIIAQKMGLV